MPLLAGDNKNTILTFRWLTLLLLILVIHSGEEGLHFASRGYALAVLFLLSNLCLYLLPSERFRSSFWTSFILLADVVFVTFAIYISGRVRGDLYLVYFLSIFAAAFGQDLRGSIAMGIMACALYGWLFYRSSSLRGLLEDPSFWVRIPFLFLSAIFTGFLSQQVRTAREEKEREATFAAELQHRLQIAIRMEEKSHQDLVAANEHKENILQSLTSGVVVVDSSRRVTTFSVSAQKITGVLPETVVGSTLDDLPQGPLEGLKDALSTAMDSEELVSGKEVEVRATGKRIPVGITTSILHDRVGKASGVIGVFADLSERKHLEEKLKHSEKLAMLGEMSAAVAHEIRNPLNSIGGFAQLLVERSPEGDRRKEYGQVIVQETERISRIIEDILDFGRQKKPDLVPTDLNQLLGELLPTLQSKASQFGVTVSSTLAPDLPPVPADGNQLRQVLLNLLHNALEAMPTGGSLTVTTGVTERQVEIAISDTGPGVDDSIKGRIFELFFTTKKGGTGLGLCVSQEIVKNHQGEILVQSEVGKGTTFTIRLPQKGLNLMPLFPAQGERRTANSAELVPGEG